ncbi:MAG: chorismate mutase [Acidilobaceae archaeon]
MLEELEDFRAEIDKIDEEIIMLIKKRLEVARRIALAKKKLGLDVTDPERERAVLASWTERARRESVPEDLAKNIAEFLIKYSKFVQRFAYGPPRNVALIGYGRMAKSIGGLLAKAGHRVIISGRRMEKAESLAKTLGCESAEVVEAIKNSEYVILAISRSALESGYVDTFSGHLKSRVVMDIASSKSGVFEKLTALSLQHGFSYISTHPLFYSVELPYGEKIVLIPSESGYSVLPEVIVFWESLGLEVIVSSAIEHEKAMAIQQVVPHIFLMAMNRVLSELWEILDVRAPERFETRNMRRLRESLETVAKNMDTVLEIQKHNEYARLAREIALRALIDVVRSVEGGNSDCDRD